MNEPDLRYEYRIYAQTIHENGSTDPWEATPWVSEDRAEIEVTADRLAKEQSPQWSIRRNYAVVMVSTEPVKIFYAPMWAG